MLLKVSLENAEVAVRCSGPERATARLPCRDLLGGVDQPADGRDQAVGEGDAEPDGRREARPAQRRDRGCRRRAGCRRGSPRARDTRRTFFVGRRRDSRRTSGRDRPQRRRGARRHSRRARAMPPIMLVVPGAISAGSSGVGFACSIADGGGRREIGLRSGMRLRDRSNRRFSPGRRRASPRVGDRLGKESLEPVGIVEQERRGRARSPA